MTEVLVPDPAARLAALQRDYLAQLPHRLTAIEEAWSRLAAGDWAPEPVRELHRLVHNLSGSGATFGIAELSTAARSFEQQLQAAIGHRSLPATEVLAQMQSALAQLRVVVSQLPVTNRFGVLPAAGVPATNGRTLFLVDADPTSARPLALQLGHYGYRVCQLTDLAALDAAIATESPAAVLLDAQLPDGDGVHVLERLRARGFGGPGILLSAGGDMAVRLSAVRAGAAAFLTKPVEIGELVDRLDTLVDPRPVEALRVLIVEDSAELAGFYGAVLEQAGLSVAVVRDPMRTLQVLDELDPDLILMDVYMPGCSGLELASVIRQQHRYLSIPIVFLSTERDLGRQLSALGLGADDFLTKPIEAGHLLRAVQNRAERARALRRLMLRDSLTGALNHTAITARLEDEIARAERAGLPLALAVIDVDQFKAVNDSYGHLIGDRVLRSLTRLLRQRLRKTDMVGRMGGEEFVIIMPDTGAEAACGLLEVMRESFAQLDHQAARGWFRLTFSCGIAAHRPGRSPTALIEAADRAMYQAKQAGRNRVLVAP